MKTLILSLVLLFTFSCDKSEDSFMPRNITPTLVYKGGFPRSSYDLKQHGKVITSQADWDSFRNNYWVRGNQINEANNINFEAEQLLLAFDSQRTTISGTLEINFGNITENQNNITVQLLYSGEAGLGQMPSRICNFVKIPKSTKPVIFLFQ